VVELNKTLIVPFDIFMDGGYHHVKVASDETSL